MGKERCRKHIDQPRLGNIGDLIVLPRSQYAHWDAGTFSGLWGDTALPGSRTYDNLPPGSAVVCHSAMIHGRRAKPGGEGNPRYFVGQSFPHCW